MTSRLHAALQQQCQIEQGLIATLKTWFDAVEERRRNPSSATFIRQAVTDRTYVAIDAKDILNNDDRSLGHTRSARTVGLAT